MATVQKTAAQVTDETKAAEEAEAEAAELRAAEEDAAIKEAEEEAAAKAKSAKASRKRKSSNYLLEEMVIYKAPGPGEKEPPRVWNEVKDGFVSPEQALEHVAKAKLVGRFRAVRLASEEFEGAVMTPEPVHTLRRVKGK